MSARLAHVGARRLGLAGVCAFLAAVIALELAPEPGIAQAEAGVAKAPRAPAALPGEITALAPLPQYAAIVERPLFDASRRPPPLAESGTPAVAADLRQLTLTGVVITPHSRFAIFQDKSPAQISRVAQGMAVGGWTLEEVRADGVVLRRGTARQRLPLYEKKDGAPATAEAAQLAAIQAAVKEQAKPAGEPRRRGPRRRR